MHYSINDELHDFKLAMKENEIHILKFEKVGNGNMAAYKMQYKLPNDNTIKEDFFWRHDIENFQEKLLGKIKSK